MQRICSIEGCAKKVCTRGFCTAHYKRWQRHGDPQGGRISPGAPMAWLTDHKDYAGDGCLLWPFSQTGKGYGGIKTHVGKRAASRVMCELAHGPAPDGRDACHSFGEDRLRDGTDSRGEKSGIAKLTVAEVLAIRAAYPGMTHQALAARHGVSPAHIGHILNRTTWTWLDEASHAIP